MSVFRVVRNNTPESAGHLRLGKNPRLCFRVLSVFTEGGWNFAVFSDAETTVFSSRIQDGKKWVFDYAKTPCRKCAIWFCCSRQYATLAICNGIWQGFDVVAMLCKYVRDSPSTRIVLVWITSSAPIEIYPSKFPSEHCLLHIAFLSNGSGDSYITSVFVFDRSKGGQVVKVRKTAKRILVWFVFDFSDCAFLGEPSLLGSRRCAKIFGNRKCHIFCNRLCRYSFQVHVFVSFPKLRAAHRR